MSFIVLKQEIFLFSFKPFGNKLFHRFLIVCSGFFFKQKNQVFCSYRHCFYPFDCVLMLNIIKLNTVIVSTGF